ncbi:MBL fold metallo-hydrolase [Fusobacterium periodonticum]|uniref:MBL fold metallo-hydrolase n=1 Tax=Fusobacterium periodonticum TaxID=860 RepID=UPI001957C160|nr:MBL fold metallo-hydrolase [Fusobacterium periodonticum]VTX78447.1 Metallo-beta-lactamase superfamily protein [Fusobacterium periodonticum]
MITRLILPVGQGAFYVEKFKNGKNIVYDCGSISNRKKIPKLIEKYFGKNEAIEALFISHLDKDHMNGVEELLKQCEVKRICFPLITEEMKLALKIKVMIEEAMGNSYSKFMKEFVEDPETAIKKIKEDIKIKLIEILPNDEENNKKNDNEDTKNQKIKRIKKKSGEDIAEEIEGLEHSCNENKWELIPYNFKQETRINEFEKKLEKEFGKKISLKEVEKIWKENEDNREKIKKVYESLKGDLNTNSMTLFSGVRQVGKQMQYDSSYVKVGCLYTGDYEAKGKNKWKTLEEAYIEYWKWIGMIQVPHHGSIRNCNDALISKKAVYFLSAGEKNTYKHPSQNVVRGIRFKYHNNLYIVTESKGLGVILNSDIEIYYMFSDYQTIEEKLENVHMFEAL